MRIIFIGSGDIGIPSLETLLASRGHEFAAVVTQPDKPTGRHQALTPSQVKVRALAAGVPVLQPEKIRNAVPELAALRPDVFVVIAYGQILPRSVLDVPSKACLNVHASLLPRHRGASPIQAAIREGDAETGITIMWMDEGLDTGAVLLTEHTPIAPDETGGGLHDRLALLAPTALMKALDLLQRNEAPRIPQDESRATLTKKLERAHGRIAWDRRAEEIERLVRAYDPWPGTHCLLPAGDGKSIPFKIHRARVIEDADANPAGGTIISADEHLRVSCGRGVLELVEVQAEGRKRMNARDFLRGHRLEPGTRLL